MEVQRNINQLDLHHLECQADFHQGHLQVSPTPEPEYVNPRPLAFREPSVISGSVERSPMSFSSRRSPPRSDSYQTMSRSEKITQSINSGELSVKDGLVAAISEFLSNGDAQALEDNYSDYIRVNDSGEYTLTLSPPTSYEPTTIRHTPSPTSNQGSRQSIGRAHPYR